MPRVKRPEGFDPPARQQPSGPKKKPAAPKPRASKQPAAPKERVPQSAAPQARPPQPSAKPSVQRAPKAPRERPAKPATRTAATDRAERRRTARANRRSEKAEARRFTRRTRNRRVALAAVAGTVVTLVGLVFVAVYSPLLALRTITIDGTARVSQEELHAAVDGQLGTPLALIDFDRLTTELGAFPLIRSYVTETLPPDTLLIHVVERQPVGSIAVTGGYHLVDPAGITLQEAVERIPGVPLIDLGGGDTSSAAFSAVVAVLLALPPELLAQVDTASARTQDDVSLVLTGVGQRVTWGSAEHSAQKAALLARLVAVTDPAQAGEFDVSAPNNGIFHPLDPTVPVP